MAHAGPVGIRSRPAKFQFTVKSKVEGLDLKVQLAKMRILFDCISNKKLSIRLYLPLNASFYSNFGAVFGKFTLYCTGYFLVVGKLVGLGIFN